MRLAVDQAARDTRGTDRREFVGMFDCSDGEACGAGQAGNGIACSRAVGKGGSGVRLVAGYGAAPGLVIGVGLALGRSRPPAPGLILRREK